MSLDGNGTYEPLEPYFPAIPNTVIKSDDFNQIILDIAAALSLAIFRDGQAVFTANQSHGGFKITNLANGVAAQDAVTVLQAFTNPTFIGTTTNGVQVTGTALKVAVANILLTASAMLDMSASAEVKLPANSSIGDVSAAELALLNGLLATTAELNKLHGALITTEELNNLHGVVSTTAELNLLHGVLLTTADFNQLKALMTEILYLTGLTGSVQNQLNSKAPIDSPEFTGIPTAPTAPPYTSTKQLATTDFVMGQTMLAGALPYFLLNNAGII